MIIFFSDYRIKYIAIRYNITFRISINFDKMFYEFDKYIGIDKFNLLHLNDSQVKLGSKKDRHECLCEGCIWKEDNKALLEDLKRRF